LVFVAVSLTPPSPKERVLMSFFKVLSFGEDLGEASSQSKYTPPSIIINRLSACIVYLALK
jgi:hypothetical protein